MSGFSRERVLSGLAAMSGVALVTVVLVSGVAAPAEPAPVADNAYIGAAKCKNCHSAEEVGNQYGAWENAAHSKAFETLASDAAKAAAKEHGIEDPQTADACLKCHTTAFGVDAKMIKRGFKPEMGVQCESCHGPGENHSKARFKAAMEGGDAPAVIEEGEIVKSPEQEVCLACHNDESPTFQPFCYYKRVSEIRHMRPMSDEEKAALMVCGCATCECTDGCPDDGCGVPQGSK